jgi:hypothetical protein
VIIGCFGITPNAYAQSAAETPEIKALKAEFLERAKRNDCKYLDEFTDRYVSTTGGPALMAQVYAINTLIKESTAKTTAKTASETCRYHDRAAALLVAIRLYEAMAEKNSNVTEEVMVTMALEGALGDAWREALAEAGVRPAMQDLVVLHLLCARKADEQQPIAFWEWMLTDPKSNARFQFFDSLLYGQSPMCANLAASAKPETACYWNALEEKVSSGSERLVSSRKMNEFRGTITGTLPRTQALTDAMIKYSEKTGRLDDPRNLAFFQSELRKLIAEACTQTLPSEAQERIRKRLRNAPTRSVEALVAAFK